MKEGYLLCSPSLFQTRKFRRFGFSLSVVVERYIFQSNPIQQLWLNDTFENLYSPEMVETAENKNLTNFN